MNHARFTTLVRTLEERARLQPRLYRAQVAAIAALGYFYVIGVLLLVVAVVGGVGYLITHVGGGAVFVKVLLPLVGFGFVLLRGLWIRLPDLEGIPLPPHQYPALAEVIERVRASIGAPRFRPLWLEPWRPGALDSTMGVLRVRVGKTWAVPLVAVIDSSGRVVAQWQGATVTIREVMAAAERSRDFSSLPGASAPGGQAAAQ